MLFAFADINANVHRTRELLEGEAARKSAASRAPDRAPAPARRHDARGDPPPARAAWV